MLSFIELYGRGKGMVDIGIGERVEISEFKKVLDFKKYREWDMLWDYSSNMNAFLLLRYPSLLFKAFYSYPINILIRYGYFFDYFLGNIYIKTQKNFSSGAKQGKKWFAILSFKECAYGRLLRKAGVKSGRT